MSKQTTIICDGCGRAVTGVGYSTLLTRLKSKGWVSLNGKEHYCKKCALLAARKRKESHHVGKAA
ncbi:hypothetical protein HMPREF1022_00906 [Desulfovibrio sp. 6_1_46AFAA]|uniref:hypothetical protein n=1 Tax=Desulfovibrio sp. 6_1_46AFAA TaxID=665942 RepID=UPI000223717E|nr:hypothetical protein [Desulfovibrio sp. 6_1_46AFAA]EGW52123.1 hypothetical protein HMPREF1022_00906 [Desulfovibrio sp. 6_1_46AFAA]